MKTWTKILLYTLCTAFALIVVLPFLMMILGSVKNARESALFGLDLPTEYAWDNYGKVLSKASVIRGFLNTIFISLATVILTDIAAAMAAFVIQRRPGRASRVSYYLLLVGLVMPVSIIPTIKLMMSLGIHNSYSGLILYFTAVNLSFAVFLIAGFMGSVPKELDEAAIVEGSSYTRLFFKIILPLLKTVIVTNTIITVLAVWDDFFGPFYLVSNSKKWTIVMSMYTFVSQYQTNWGLVFAFMMLMILPMLLMYFFLQRFIIEGITAGSVKG
jgi:raffinose/stachyose/melibiose transport system permease protein